MLDNTNKLRILIFANTGIVCKLQLQFDSKYLEFKIISSGKLFMPEY